MLCLKKVWVQPGVLVESKVLTKLQLLLSSPADVHHHLVVGFAKFPPMVFSFVASTLWSSALLLQVLLLWLALMMKP